jgi:hypothetical protein
MDSGGSTRDVSYLPTVVNENTGERRPMGTYALRHLALHDVSKPR